MCYFNIWNENKTEKTAAYSWNKSDWLIKQQQQQQLTEDQIGSPTSVGVALFPVSLKRINNKHQISKSTELILQEPYASTLISVFENVRQLPQPPVESHFIPWIQSETNTFVSNDRANHT